MNTGIGILDLGSRAHLQKSIFLIENPFQKTIFRWDPRSGISGRPPKTNFLIENLWKNAVFWCDPGSGILDWNKNCTPEIFPTFFVFFPQPVFGVPVFRRPLKIAFWIFSSTGVRCSGLPSTPKLSISKFWFSSFGGRPIELGVRVYYGPIRKLGTM